MQHLRGCLIPTHTVYLFTMYIRPPAADMPHSELRKGYSRILLWKYNVHTLYSCFPLPFSLSLSLLFSHSLSYSRFLQYSIHEKAMHIRRLVCMCYMYTCNAHTHTHLAHTLVHTQVCIQLSFFMLDWFQSLQLTQATSGELRKCSTLLFALDILLPFRLLQIFGGK